MNIPVKYNLKISTRQEQSPPKTPIPSEDILDREWWEARIKGDFDTLIGIEQLKFREIERKNRRWLKEKIKESEGGLSV